MKSFLVQDLYFNFAKKVKLILNEHVLKGQVK